MTYDGELLDRLREKLVGETVTERVMFGGVAMIVGGHMAVAASRSGGLMVRVDPADAESLLGPGVARTEMRGRALAGWLLVEPAALCSDVDLERWVAGSLAYVRSLPPR